MTKDLASDPPSDIHQHPTERDDEGSLGIPSNDDHPSIIPPQSGETRDDVGSQKRAVSSAELFNRFRDQIGGTSRQIWGLHIRIGAVTFLVGETSIGKTVFLYNLAYHLAKGIEFLGIGPEGPVRVLYVDFESNEEVMVEHFSAIGTAEGWDFFELSQDARGQALVDQLREEIRSGTYDLVIIDPLMEAFPVKDENDNIQANAQMLAFRELARSTNVAVVLVHNSGLTKRRRGKFLGRGATSRLDRADVGINVYFTKDGGRELKIAKARGPNLNDKIRFRFAEDLGFELIECSGSNPALESTLQTQTVDILRTETSQGRPEMERKTFLKYLNILERSAESQALDRALRRNIATGALSRPQKGKYALPLATSEPSPQAHEAQSSMAEEEEEVNLAD